MTQHFESKLIHHGALPDAAGVATHVPIYQSVAFEHDTAQGLEDVFQGRAFGHYYARVSNPTITALEARLAALEEGRGAVVYASGMAAITSAVFALAKAGDSIVVGKSLFGSTYYLFKGLIQDAGIEVRFVDSTQVSAFEAAITDTTRLLYVEALGNPKLDVPDLAALSKLAQAQDIPLVVDSTFTTAALLQAKKWGVHVVLAASTKYLAGAGAAVGGVVVDTGLFQWKKSRSPKLREQQAFGEQAFLTSLKKVRANAGACQAPFNAYLTALGLDTLALRMKQHSHNALAVATALQAHPQVVHVTYPGLKTHPQYQLAQAQLGVHQGGMLTLRVGSKERAFQVIDALKMVKNGVNLGDAKTLAVYPASTIYRNLTPEQRVEAGVYDDLIRVSIGLEHPDDIIADFTQALEVLL